MLHMEPSGPPALAVVCFINDPLDPPGGRRIGGGHLVLRELSEFLVSRGFDVTLITRRNDPSKPLLQPLGPRLRLHRVAVGPAAEMEPADVGHHLDALLAAALPVLRSITGLVAIHSQYWIAGEVCRRANLELGVRHVHHMLSFGRQKRRRGEPSGATDGLRDDCEVRVANAVDTIVAQCPSEASDLLELYPELTHRRVCIIPHGIDTDAFSP